ncbi:DUF952 domain-containing protein [Nocardia terpenica]|uniref:Glutathione S-transferase n=1 Tax=Nocardia terpenica TaxID=455432 RepID=A0A161Z5G4_9NOCA|nr:DUF952 domain-containing protein [Nocardia terpenica]KZM75094.1 glutathione S-transferase [Nocardia terpenica]MBF6065541.1 DUF952 domain-containing protein [Nocardia terpenica]MBF6108657.1 DUF952 domain-containing protein [Nocardia terpenica]MBF6115687.1 DUF952 domain-containing protein [Nocardia terpenica]MBF6122786.1 DUF952 domain-containing protein [Nocardia terpenica]
MVAENDRIGKAHRLVHLCTRQEWAQAQVGGQRRAPSLDSDGFIHLSTPEQVHVPANLFYAGQRDLVLLWLDPDLLGDVRFEPGVPAGPDGMLFPHLYGPVPVAAVAEVTEYRPGPDGVFPAITPPDLG